MISRDARLSYKVLRLGLQLLSSTVATALVFPLALFLRAVHLFRPIREDRLFIGLDEIANIIHSVSDCLSERSVRVNALIITNVFYGMNNIKDKKNLNVRCFQNQGGIKAVVLELTLPFRLIREMVRNDVFLIIWNRSFMSFSMDYFFLRLAGKRLLLMHCGDDVRYRPMQRVIDAELGHRSWPSAKASLFRLLTSLYHQTLSESIASVISHPDQCTFQTGPLFHFCFPQKAVIREMKHTSGCPLILHCPSERSECQTYRYRFEGHRSLAGGRAKI